MWNAIADKKWRKIHEVIYLTHLKSIPTKRPNWSLMNINQAIQWRICFWNKFHSCLVENCSLFKIYCYLNMNLSLDFEWIQRPDMQKRNKGNKFITTTGTINRNEKPNTEKRKQNWNNGFDWHLDFSSFDEFPQWMPMRLKIIY